MGALPRENLGQAVPSLLPIEPLIDHPSATRIEPLGFAALLDAAAEGVRQLCRRAAVSRLKILTNLNIAEKRLPQDGRARLRIA